MGWLNGNRPHCRYHTIALPPSFSLLLWGDSFKHRGAPGVRSGVIDDKPPAHSPQGRSQTRQNRKPLGYP